MDHQQPNHGAAAQAGRQPVVGMVGAGQLARMTAAAAVGLGIRFRVLAASPDESAAQVCADTILGDYRSTDDLLAFAAGCDVVTFDHEHVPQPQLAALEQAGHVIRPGPAALRLTQDKLVMRERLTGLGVPCPRFEPVSSLADVVAFAERTGWPVMLKAISGGYDGRGVWVCRSPAEAEVILSHGLKLLAEEYVPFERELAVLIARSPSGHGAAYPVVQSVQRDGICVEVLAPAPQLSEVMALDAQQLGLELARDLDVTGLLAVELFQTRSGGLLVNELAMRPHNTGHWTIDGARTSQFEQHLRAVLNLPLGSPQATSPVAVMANVLGGTDPDLYGKLNHVMAADTALKVQLYGKPVRPGRKVGHVTALGGSLAQARDRARRAANYLATGAEDLAVEPIAVEGARA
ncbi:MAG TPA: 5-(carboxyamino)imidazole ribonucleotide synthase [Streptosporangiaceae bacterium]|nr:5-(carboxyamino)imidazole ribonucleotide synthase [Streptosporangiaceae bacterium]